MMKIFSRKNQGVDAAQSTHGNNAASPDSSRLDGEVIDSKQVRTRGSSMLERICLFKLRPPQTKNNLKPTLANFSAWEGVAGPEGTLAENLLKHLNLGSHDALNLMNGIFEFHHFDQTLLNKYISNRSPDNLMALKSQIENLAFSSSDAPIG